MTYDSDNVFAKILRGEIPSTRVYEDEDVLAIHDINPKAPTHVLVITKAPYVDLMDFLTYAAPEEISSFFKTVAKIATDLNLTENGFRFVSNNGIESGQEVYHFHVHLITGKKLGPIA